VDLIATLFILAITGLIFSSTFSAGFACLGQSKEYKVASAIAQQKMEQLRTMNYESLDQPLLLSAGAIDADPTTSPYSFTQVDNVAGKLRQGTGTLRIETVSADVKRVRITVSWMSRTGNPQRSVQVSTLFADKRTRRVT